MHSWYASAFSISGVLSGVLKFFSVHLRCTSHFTAELPVEVGKVAEAGVVCDFGYTSRRTAQGFAGSFNPQLCQIFDCSKPEGLPETAHKIAFAQMRQLCKLLNRNRIRKVLLDIGEYRPQIFRWSGSGRTIGAKVRRCSEQIEEAEQFTFQQKVGDGGVFLDTAENLTDGCVKSRITGTFR